MAVTDFLSPEQLQQMMDERFGDSPIGEQPLQFRDPQQYYMENIPAFGYDRGWRGPVGSTGLHNRTPSVQYQEQSYHPESWKARALSQEQLQDPFWSTEREYNPMLQKALISQQRANLYDSEIPAATNITSPSQDFNFSEYQGPSQEDEGIPALAEKKGFFPSILNLARGAINRYNPLYKGSQNYNPNLQGQVDALTQKGYLSGTGGKRGPYEITRGPLAGKNLVSLFGTNDYDQMLQNKADWFQRRKDSGKGFSQTNWDAVIAEQIKQKQNKDAVSGAASGKTTTGGGAWNPNQAGAATLSQLQSPAGNYAAATARTSSRVGRGGQQKAYGLAQGGRVGYKTGGRVGILSVF